MLQQKKIDMKGRDKIHAVLSTVPLVAELSGLVFQTLILHEIFLSLFKRNALQRSRFLSDTLSVTGMVTTLRTFLSIYVTKG